MYYTTIATEQQTKQEETVMTENYKGMDKDFNYRLAEINFNDEKNNV